MGLLASYCVPRLFGTRYEANEAIYFGLCNTVRLKRGGGLIFEGKLISKDYCTCELNLLD